MKLAILFFGVSYCKNIDNMRLKNPVNYKFSVDNYKKFIFEYFKNYDIDTYICTNIIEPKIKQELIDEYKPIYIEMIPTNLKRYMARNEKFKRVIELCFKSNIIYDLILITRFDLLFKIPFSDVHIDMTTINVVSQLKRPRTICDNFYILPYSLLKGLYEVVIKYIIKTAHYYIIGIEKICKINYLYNEKVSIKQLKFYKIKRIRELSRFNYKE